MLPNTISHQQNRSVETKNAFWISILNTDGDELAASTSNQQEKTDRTYQTASPKGYPRSRRKQNLTPTPTGPREDDKSARIRRSRIAMSQPGLQSLRWGRKTSTAFPGLHQIDFSTSSTCEGKLAIRNRTAIDKFVSQVKRDERWYISIQSLEIPGGDSDPHPVARVRYFAEHVKRTRGHRFEELMLCSMCCVLKKTAAKDAQEIFDRHFQHTSTANRKELLAGTKWANKLVNDLCEIGWGPYGTQLLRYCKLSSRIL